MKPRWKWYQEKVAKLFSRVPGATVEEDVREEGSQSGVKRQIDVRILLNLEIKLQDFTLSIPLKLIVDCKHYNKKLNVKTIGEIAELKEDVRAQLAIAVSPLGVTKGASARSESLGVYPVTVTWDLFLLMKGLSSEVACLVCDRFQWVSWSYDSVVGHCDYCGSMHIRCGDCLAIFAIPDPDGTPLECPECEAVYVASYDPRDGDTDLEVHDMLSVMVLTQAYEQSSRCLTKRQVDNLVGSTRWQHWQVGSPLINLTEEALVEWKGADRLCLTDEGIRVVEEHILPARSPWYY